MWGFFYMGMIMKSFLDLQPSDVVLLNTIKDDIFYIIRTTFYTKSLYETTREQLKLIGLEDFIEIKRSGGFMLHLELTPHAKRELRAREIYVNIIEDISMLTTFNKGNFNKQVEQLSAYIKKIVIGDPIYTPTLPYFRIRRNQIEDELDEITSHYVKVSFDNKLHKFTAVLTAKGKKYLKYIKELLNLYDGEIDEERLIEAHTHYSAINKTDFSTLGRIFVNNQNSDSE